MLGSARPPNRPTVVVPVSRALVPPRTRVLHLREPLAFSIASARDGGRYVIAARVGADYQRDGARRSSVIYIQKSRARTSIVFFVWLMYATPDNCDKTGSRRRPAHVDETGVPDLLSALRPGRTIRLGGAAPSFIFLRNVRERSSLPF